MPSLAEIVKFLSGNVPGGILPYLYIILLINLVFYVLGKHSELMNWPSVKRKLVRFSVFVLIMYAMVWYGVRPESLNPRFIIYPTISENISDHLRIPLFVDGHLKKQIQADYFYYPAKWIVSSAEKDSLMIKKYQMALAGRLDAELWLTSEMTNDGISWQIWQNGETSPLYSGKTQNFTEVVSQIKDAVDKLIIPEKDLIQSIEPVSAEAAELFWLSLNDSLDEVIKNYVELDTIRQKELVSQIAYSFAIVHKAYGKKKEQQKITNPFKKDMLYKNWFIRGRERMIAQGRNNPDNLAVNLILADSYILEENFNTAELALKNAFVADKYSAEIYYLFSFLDPSRYLDLEIENIQEMLEMALLYDPLYEFALIRYIGKIGEESITSDRYIYDFTVQKCLDMLELKPSSYLILNNLAGLYLLGGEFENAMLASDRAMKIAPQYKSVIYNAGIIRYRLEKFNEALPLFTELIDRFNHLDARLYRAMIYRKNEEYKKAVLDFRYRILNKLSDDDKYAREAVKGIRKIRNDLAEKGIDLDDIVPPYRIRK